MSVREQVMSALLHDGNPKSVAARARAKRWSRFTEAFPDFADMRVLDLGGWAAFWRTMDRPPAAVTVLNLEPDPSDEPWIEVVTGDACRPPEQLRAESYDLVFSNSLIEHVGGFANRQRVADVVHSKADRHWVQTPYRYFPVEPHWLFPGFQFLPLNARTAITRRWKLGHMHRPDRADALVEAASVELVTLTEMRALYPDSEVWCERFGGLVKSLTAIKGAAGQK